MQLVSSVPQSNEVRHNLAAAYRIIAKFAMDDLTYTHLSARAPNEQCFYIYPLGLLFSEVSASQLLKVSLDGKVIEGTESQYNKTGYVMHGAVYRQRSDINAVFHLHTTAGVTVSAMECGLLPISQFSFHFYNRLAYHDYDSLALDHQRHGQQIAKDLDQHQSMILRNHGTLTCGATIHEAFFYAYYLEQACKVQCASLSSGQKLVTPTPEVCEQAAQDMRNFEDDLGFRDWSALLRQLDREEPTYQD